MTVHDNPEQRLTFLIARVNAGLSRVSKPMFKRFGVDPVTSRVLVLVLNRERTLVGDVVEFLGLPQSTVSHQVKRLEGAGLLMREQDDGDNRAYKLRLTTRGRRIARACDERSQRLNRSLAANLPPAALRTLLNDLTQLSEYLERTDPQSIDVNAD